MHILGITGGIATGKSTVAAMLAEWGAPTLSADTLARQLLLPGTPTTQAVLAAFPRCADPQQPGVIDRRALGRIVFADADARRQLEALTHPAIIGALQDAAGTWRAQPGGGCAVLEIPLLFEAHLEALPDVVVVAACSPETQIARLRARAGISEGEAEAQIAAQWPLEEKRRRASVVIDTDGSPEDTRRQAAALWKKECCR